MKEIEIHVHNRRRDGEREHMSEDLKKFMFFVIAIILLYLEIHFKTNIFIYMGINITYISCI